MENKRPLSLFSKIVVETDSKSQPIRVATITADGIDVRGGFRVRLTPVDPIEECQEESQESDEGNSGTASHEENRKKKKVCPAWAFVGDRDSGRINKEIYEKICKKWKIKRFSGIDGFDIPIDDKLYSDLIISRREGDRYSLYKIIKNETNLTPDEIALVCDNGSLCFGYTIKNGLYYVFED